MNWKKFWAIPVAALLLFATACQEQAPSDANSGNGGVLVSQQESGSSQTPLESDPEKPYQGITLSYRTYAFYQNESYPISYEFSVENVQIFDTYADAGLPEKDFLADYITDLNFVLVDIHVKKTEGPERSKCDTNDTMEEVILVNRTLEESYQEKGSYYSPPPCYFSGDPEVEDRYYSYWLDPGEERTFQLGWCLDDSVPDAKNPGPYLNDTQGLALYIGMGDGLNGNSIPLTP